MNKFRRFFNQNRKTIFIAIAFVAFIIIILQILDFYAKKKLEEQRQRQQYYKENSQNVNKSNKSVISDYEVGETIYKKQENLVSKFAEYCNNKQIQEAYELLSSDCKEELYSSFQDFKKYYYDNIFYTKRNFTMQNWNNWTYIVKYTDDILSTGRVTNSSSVQDYITIVFENEEMRLNINNYLGKTEINKEKEIQNLKIKILNKKSYIDYEIYDFEVENKTGNALILDTLSDNSKIYLKDSKGTNHYSINNEISNDSLIIKNNYKKRISIKFDNPYINGRKINSVNFDNIIVCDGENLENVTNRVKFSIDLEV